MGTLQSKYIFSLKNLVYAFILSIGFLQCDTYTGTSLGKQECVNKCLGKDQYDKCWCSAQHMLSQGCKLEGDCWVCKAPIRECR